MKKKYFLSVLVNVLCFYYVNAQTPTIAVVAIQPNTLAKDSIILTSFNQGAANNCVSIALIKAAIYKYGYNHIFSFKRTDNNYTVSLRDGTSLTISESELQYTAKLCMFNTDNTSSRVLGKEFDSILFYVHLSYACIAKYVNNNGYWGCVEQNSPHLNPKSSFNKALKFITNKGYCTDYAYRLLGLKIKNGEIKDYTENTNLPDKGTILYSGGHCVAVYNTLVDCYGHLEPINTCSTDFKNYFVLE